MVASLSFDDFLSLDLELLASLSLELLSFDLLLLASLSLLLDLLDLVSSMDFDLLRVDFLSSSFFLESFFFLASLSFDLDLLSLSLLPICVSVRVWSFYFLN